MFENDHGNPCLSGALFHFLLFFVTGREAPTMVNEISAIAISTPGKRKKEKRKKLLLEQSITGVTTVSVTDLYLWWKKEKVYVYKYANTGT